MAAGETTWYGGTLRGLFGGPKALRQSRGESLSGRRNARKGVGQALDRAWLKVRANPRRKPAAARSAYSTNRSGAFRGWYGMVELDSSLTL